MRTLRSEGKGAFGPWSVIPIGIAIEIELF